MKLLWMFFVLPVVLGQPGFGRSYLRNSRLCHQWNCINTKLGLPDSLPLKSVAEESFKRILPEGPWQDGLRKILDVCYEGRTRQYTNTCPGQALLHCIVDQMIENCPEGSTRKDDACSPVTSLAGLKHMFSQSRYDNLEKNLPRERRPLWFLKNYFDQKCCDLPVMFNSTVLQECGFSSFITYYDHEPRYQDKVNLQKPTPTPMTNSSQFDAVRVVDLDSKQLPNIDISNTDPLDCCDMTEFMESSWRSECGFHLTWKGHERLVIGNSSVAITTEPPMTTTTAKPDAPKDLMLVPQSCQQETCVFRKLGIIKETGSINTMAFMKMLDNFTDAHPSWKKATARVVTKCLSRKVRDYDDQCEINKILACTLDLLTENCPYKRKSEDTCKHNKHKSGCQISSSKYRPKYRREICLLPPLIHQDHLSECGLESLYKAEHVVVTEPKPRKYSWAADLCQDQLPSTTCIMNKMDILNKYKFMDYFKMKDRLRKFTSNQAEWSALLDIYTSAFINMPMYGQHCSSQKKLLNVVDAMLMTCPKSKRVKTPQCQRIFKAMAETTPSDHQNITKPKLDEIIEDYHHIFMPDQPTTEINNIVKKQMYDYGLLDSEDSPKVKVIDVKSVSTTPKAPLVILPVYLRESKKTPYLHKDTMYMSNPYFLP